MSQNRILLHMKRRHDCRHCEAERIIDHVRFVSERIEAAARIFPDGNGSDSDDVLEFWPPGIGDILDDGPAAEFDFIIRRTTQPARVGWNLPTVAEHVVDQLREFAGRINGAADRIEVDLLKGGAA